MTMTNEEIVRNFNQAKNRAMQVQILADLNATTPDEIKRILLAGGIDHRKLPRGPRKAVTSIPKNSETKISKTQKTEQMKISTAVETATVPTEDSLSISAIGKELEQVEIQIADRIDELNMRIASAREELSRCQAQRDLLEIVRKRLTTPCKKMEEDSNERRSNSGCNQGAGRRAVC